MTECRSSAAASLDAAECSSWLAPSIHAAPAPFPTRCQIIQSISGAWAVGPESPVSATTSETEKGSRPMDGPWYRSTRVRVVFLLLATLGALFLLINGPRVTSPPVHFNFRYFETFPEKEIIPRAQKFVDERFPAGADLKTITKEFAEAGAKCGRGQFKTDIYYECDYQHPGSGSGFFITVEWKIIIDPDESETRSKQITVVRSLTAP